jgi:hypothetical protein
MSVRVLSAPAVACCLIVLTAGGCGKSADEIKAARAEHGAEHDAAASAAAAAAAAKAPKTVPGDAELVSAVAKDSSRNDDNPLFDLRFRLLARPEVARPLQIELVAVPRLDTQFVRLQLSVIPGEGITLDSDGTTFEDRDLATGERVRHTITAVPGQSGVLQLFVSAVAVTDKTNLTRQFAIPLIAFGAQPATAAPR